MTVFISNLEKEERNMRKTLLSTLAVAVLLGASSVCPAQESPSVGLKPVLTISSSGYDALFEDIGFIGKLGGEPEMAKGLETVLKMITEGPMSAGPPLPGLDKTKPWGAVVRTDGQEFLIVGFVPVSDMKQLLQVLAPMLGEGEDAGNGVLKLQQEVPPGAMFAMGPPPIYVKEQGGWAFISTNPDALANLPADPLKLLGGLNEKYDLALRASIQNIPAKMRQDALEMWKAGAEMGMVRMPDESDEDFAIRSALTKRAIDQLATVTDDLDQVLVGLALDQSAGTSYLEFEVTAVEGTKTAADFAEMKEAKTDFAGFDLPGATLTGNWAGTLSDTDVIQAKDSIAQIRAKTIKELKNEELSDEQVKLATQLIGDLFDVLEKTIENKVADGGVVLLLNPGALTFVAGGVVADGAKLESAIKRLADELQKEEPGFAQLLKLDAETHEGVRFHTLDMPVDEEEMAKVFGDTLNIVVGISENSIYLGVGPEAVKTLKQVIDKSKAEAGKTIPPLRIVVAAGPIAKFIAAMEENEDTVKWASGLEQSGGKDHITIIAKAIPNGANMRVEVEEGILKMLGTAIAEGFKQGMPGGGPDPADDPF
jgi:hypothetical protein